MKKKILSLISFVFVLSAVSVATSGCSKKESVSISTVETAVDNRDFRMAMEEILKLSDKEILSNDSLMHLLAASYYGCTLQEKRQIALEANALFVTPDGKEFMINDYQDSIIKVYSIPQMDSLRTIRTGFHIEKIAISPDGTTLAVAKPNGTLALYDYASGREKRILNGGSPDGKKKKKEEGGKMVGYKQVLKNTKKATKNKGEETFLFDEKTENKPVESRVSNKVNAIQFVNDETLFSLIGDNVATLWNINNGNSTVLDSLDFYNVNNAYVNKDASRLVVASNDGNATIYNISDPVNVVKVSQIKPGDNNVIAAVFTPDNKSLVTLTGDDMIKIWDLSNNKTKSQIKANSQLCTVDFSSDGKFMIVGSVNDVFVIDLESGKVINRILTEGRLLAGAHFIGKDKLIYADTISFELGDFLYGKKLIEAARKYIAD